MADLLQDNFDRAERIADALHAQAGIEQALLDVLTDGIDLSRQQEAKVFALIGAQAQFRDNASRAADEIARSDRGGMQ